MACSKPVNHRFIADVRGESTKTLKPISGYEHEELVSIEEACKPLESLLDHKLAQNIITAKTKTEERKHDLSHDEAAAIFLYTMEWKERENSLYMVLNQTLRIADPVKLRPWFKYLKLFLTGFYKLPSTVYQTVWRGVSENLTNDYKKGEEITWWPFSSCTSAISVLESPIYVGTSGPRTMFSIETSSGKSIKEYSCFDKEDEILLPPGIHLKVIDKSSPAKDLHIIHLREIEPPTSVITPKQKPQPVVPSSTYSQEELPCKGRACARCGYCRDRYWRPDGSGKYFRSIIMPNAKLMVLVVIIMVILIIVLLLIMILLILVIILIMIILVIILFMIILVVCVSVMTI